MYPSNGLGGSSRTSVGHPTGSGDLSMPSELDARGRPSHRYHQYANIVPARPAPPPPTSGISGHPRRIANRRGSLGVVPPSVSGLSATRPMIQSDLQLPPLEPLLPSTRTSGIGRTRRRGAPGPRLGGGGELGSSLSMTGGLGDAPPPSLLSRSQPIDIVPLSPLASINDWRNRISPGSPLENPTLRETRREARHRARDDWERDAELHPNMSLESDLEDSTDGETDSPSGSQLQPHRRRNSLRRTPELENLRGGNDSGISLNTGRNLGFSLQEPDDFGLSGLDLNTPSGLTLGARGRTHSRTGGTLNGYRETRLAFPAPGSTPMESLPELDLGPGAMDPLRRSRYPIGPPPTGPLPPLPTQVGLPRLRGFRRHGDLSTTLPPLHLPRRRSVQESSGQLGEWSDPFATPPHIPGQHRIREHMLEFTDGDYVVRIRNNRLVRQQEQEAQRTRSTTTDMSPAERLAEARRLGF